MDDEVPSCPFCAALELLAMEDEGKHYLLCLECKCCGPVEDCVEEALESWCMRPTEDDIGDLISRAKRTILLS